MSIHEVVLWFPPDASLTTRTGWVHEARLAAVTSACQGRSAHSQRDARRDPARRARSRPRIQNVQDLQAERRLAGLVEAGIALASELDVDALLQRIGDLAREVIGARYAAVGIVDREGQLTRFVHSGIDQ